MLRLLLAALLVANAVFFAWTRGWFAPAAPGPALADREPQRLAAQLRPEAVVVLPPRAASAALRAARDAAAVCLEAGPVDASGIEAAEAVLAAASLPAGSWSRQSASATAAQWLVAVARPADAGTRRAREADLRRTGLAFEAMDAPASAPGSTVALWVLSRHETRAAAETALTALPPLRGLRVVALPPPAPRHWLRVPQADAALRARLAGLDVAGGFRPCAERATAAR